MSVEEMKLNLIDEYCNYQEIKRGLKEKSEVLEYKIKVTAVKLSLLDVDYRELEI